jgi:hypothetical protein
VASDIMGRRQIMQQRLDRVRDLELAIREQVQIIAQSAGMTVEELDFDGSFRASLASLASLAARRPTFDVVLALPTAPAGVRIQQLHNRVEVQVITHEDGPYRSSLPTPVGETPLTMAQSAAMTHQAAAQSPLSRPVVSGPQNPAPTASQAQATLPGPLSPPAPPSARSPEPIEEEGLVVSDLAALLWEGFGEPHHDERV